MHLYELTSLNMFLNIFNLSLNPGSQYFVLIDPIVSSIIFTSFVIILLTSKSPFVTGVLSDLIVSFKRFFS